MTDTKSEQDSALAVATPGAAPARGWTGSLTLLTRWRRQAVLPILVAVMIYAQIRDHSFLTWPSLRDLLTQNAAVGVIAVGLTFVLIGGGIDISVGAVYAIGSAVFAEQAVHHATVLAGAIALLVGMLVGLVNGLLITRLGFHPFITTLGTASICSGGIIMYAGLNAITPTRESFFTLGSKSIGQVPYVVVLLGVVFVVAALVLHRTAFGRSLFVIGGAPDVARHVGMRTDLLRTITYVGSGGCAALAGMLFASQSGVGQSTIGGNSLSLTALAMVVLGGTSLYGGQGAMWRTVVGFLILSSISTLFVVLAIGQPVQDIVEGVVVVIALVLDAMSRRERL